MQTKDDEGRVGVRGRVDIGLLIWERNKESTQCWNLGPSLKTPLLPIWMTLVNGNWGVLFNSSRELMKSHSAENRFELYYYNGVIVKEDSDTILTVDTRGRKSIKETTITDTDEVEDNSDPLEKAIQTK